MIIVGYILLFVLAGVSGSATDDVYSSTFTKRHLGLLKARTKEMFEHAWGSYIDHGFPYDEVRPLSCVPHKRDWKDSFNTVTNDVMGNFSLTVFDNLDSFIIFDEPQVFKDLIYWIRDTYPNFEINSNVQVFETNIRILGGLLSAHLYASDKRQGFAIEGYDGFLLRLAHDLGERLILAFDTVTSIPYPRTNLAKGPLGVPKKLQIETCTAGAGSPVLEFTLLSKLTGDLKFERQSKKLFKTLWNSRTDLNLIPMTIDPLAGKWMDSVTGIGASVDSFYEYALKSSILFDDNEFLDIWKIGYQALNTHLRNGWVYENVDTRTGQVFTNWLDSLSAFWPGLQVLAGDIKNAVKFHAVFLKIWETFDAIPERWNLDSLINDDTAAQIKKLPSERQNELLVDFEIALEWYPLRPEFIESTYHLYRATRDPIYLQIGQDFLHKLETKYKAPCGFAGMLDIRKNTYQDRMESFVLSETLKYLYLLFDDENPVHNNNQHGNIIFSTELHPLWFDKQLTPEVTGFNWFMNNEESSYSPENYTNFTVGYTNPIFEILKGNSPNFFKNWWNNEAKNIAEEALFINEKSELAKKIIGDSVLEIDDPDVNKIELIKRLLEVHDTFSKDGANTILQELINDVEVEFSLELQPDIINLLKTITLEEDQEIEQEQPSLITTKFDSYNISQEFYYQFDECVVPSVYKSKNGQLPTSALLSQPWFYHIDNRYSGSLIKPKYIMNDNNLTHGANTVELSYDFYHRFSQPDAYSARYPTSEVFEALFDPRTDIRNNPISRLTSGLTNATLVQDNDLFVEKLSGSRIRFEKLGLGDIDHFNNLITKEILDKFVTDSETEKVFRILKINGVDVSQGQIIWLNGIDAKDNNNNNTHSMIHLLIEETTVVNFVIWLG